MVDGYSGTLDLASRRTSQTLTLRRATPDEACAQLRTRILPTSIRWSDGPVSESHLDEGALHVCGSAAGLGDPPTIGTSFVLPFAEPSAQSLGLTSRQDRFGNTFLYQLSWLGECSRLGPCDEAVGTLARFELSVEHAAATTVLCAGERTTTPTRTRCAIDETPAPTYSALGFVASDAFVRSRWTEAAGVVVDRYEVEQGETGATVDGATIAGFLEFITDVLGPFPYGDTLRIAFVPSNWLGFEHPANVVVSDTTHLDTISYDAPVRHTIFHEIVHQWAGDRTTLADRYDFAWKEAIAEYLAYVHEDAIDPASSSRTRRGWDSLARFASVYPRPLDDPPPPFEVVSYQSYGTGPMMLLTLEAMVGRATVIEGLRRFLEEPGVRDTQDLIDALASAAGVSLGAFEDAYVFGVGEPDWPSFEVAIHPDVGSLTITATQHVRAGGPRPARLPVRIVGAASSVDLTLDFGLDTPVASASTTIAFEDDVVDVVLDPEHFVLDYPFLAGAVGSEPEPRRPLHP